MGMRDNVVHLAMRPGEMRHSRPVYQYDYGQVLVLDGLELPDAYEVHFANGAAGESVTQIGGASGVSIPDAMLLSGAPVHVWLYLHTGTDDGETVLHGMIPVILRARPTTDTPTPVQQDAITEAIAALNAAVEECREIAEGMSGGGGGGGCDCQVATAEEVRAMMDSYDSQWIVSFEIVLDDTTGMYVSVDDAEDIIAAYLAGKHVVLYWKEDGDEIESAESIIDYDPEEEYCVATEWNSYRVEDGKLEKENDR